MIFPLYFHYKDISCQDPLLKLNHANVMEVLGLCEIRFIPKDASDFRIQFGKLAMEIPHGQRFIQIQRGPYFQAEMSFQSNLFLGSEKDTRYVSDFVRQNALRGHGISYLLVRISIVLSMLDSSIEIRKNPI